MNPKYSGHNKNEYTMSNLKTNYMGLELKNPIVVGANNMVTNIYSLKQME